MQVDETAGATNIQAPPTLKTFGYISLPSGISETNKRLIAIEPFLTELRDNLYSHQICEGRWMGLASKLPLNAELGAQP